MESGIDADAPLDYATIQIFPPQSRYEIFVCGGDEVEKLATGVLEHLLSHLPGVYKLYTKGSNAIFKLQLEGEHKNAEWFTKSTLQRFLQFVGSSDRLKSIKNIEGEIIQLGEDRKFHLSLFSQGNRNQFEDDGSDGTNSSETTSTPKPAAKDTSADYSKNELLRAMDLRLTALKKDLLAAVMKSASGSNYFSEEIMNLVQFCGFFGAAELKDSLCKFLELIPESELEALVNDEKKSFSHVSKTDNSKITKGVTQNSKTSPAVTPVKYGVSPAKVAQVERQSSTESEESSESSDGKQVAAERSRSVTRSAQPRRSASPMRRVQIGRAGPRRAAAVAIKSLGFYPRDRMTSHTNAAVNSSEDERSEEPGKKSEGHVRRMSVQDKINLFESKQKDQSSNIMNSTSNISLFTSKSVLRRWSAGIADSGQCQLEAASKNSVSHFCNDVTEKSKDSVEEKMETESTSECQNTVETSEAGMEQIMEEMGKDDPANFDPESNLSHTPKNDGKLTASTELSKQKETEFNDVLKNIMDNNSERTRKLSPSTFQSVSSEKRGGSYDHYKEKRDQKLRAEYGGKRAEKEAQIRAMQQILDERKFQMTSAKSKSADKRNQVRKTQKPVKSLFQPAGVKSDSPKPSVAKKLPSKVSSLPATRKSWPSAPSTTRMVSSSPSNISIGTSSAVTTPRRRKPQALASVPRSNAKVEKPQPPQMNTKGRQTDTNRNLKGMKEKVQRTQTKSDQTTTKKAKSTKPKVVDVATECHDPVPSKPSFYNKMTKKSSIVPLESKTRKGFGVGPGAVPSANKTKNSSKLDESPIQSRSTIETEKIDLNVTKSVEVTQQLNLDCSLSFTFADSESVAPVSNHEGIEVENINQVAFDGNVFSGTADSQASFEPHEESTISPTAWVEAEEQRDLTNSHDNIADANDMSQSSALNHLAPVESSSPCIRHSLSQMLQDESYESDITEWGNAENPPSMIYQKDVPKGLKRLLKFARKSKGDTNMSGWSSPSVISEGEDEAEESKAISKRSAENLLRKAALHSKIRAGQQKTSLSAGNEKNIEVCGQSSTSIPDAWSSQKSQKGNVSDSISTTKASRSFFSLSAFRGSKLNESKFQ